MEQNKKNARIFYLTLAVVLTVVIVLVIATTVARRSNPNPQESGNPAFNEDDEPTFVSPVNGTVSKEFSGEELVYCITMDEYSTHQGIDISASVGSEVVSVADGVVSNIWDDALWGKCVSVEHSNDFVSIYRMLDQQLADGIECGKEVKAGDVLGAVSEGCVEEIAQEPHLHLEMTLKHKKVDPRNHINFPKPDDDNSQVESKPNDSQPSTESTTPSDASTPDTANSGTDTQKESKN